MLYQSVSRNSQLVRKKNTVCMQSQPAASPRKKIIVRLILKLSWKLILLFHSTVPKEVKPTLCIYFNIIAKDEFMFKISDV